ncbi:proteinase-activated receptor 4 [Megalops cyprinoides]|uniref:proteinase-activated receptor 4 n=1 Tax=Megalops cyprinoides TaxID=118141 RepID=UPI001863DC49|nr:proteinase-activated receptor 4 [Megalops cyprinoides]
MALLACPQAVLLLLPLAVLLAGCSPTPTEECPQMGFRLRSFHLISRCNITVLAEKQKQEIQASTTVLLIPCLYLLAFLIGLPANIIALWVLVFRTKRLPATWLLINLTATDLMLLAVLPFRIAYHFHGNDWVFGEPLCRLVTALFYGNMYGSVLCLTLVSVDRYVALVHPFGARTLRSWRSSLCMSAVVWVVILLAMLPLLLSRQSFPLSDPPITTCHDALPEVDQETFFQPYFATLFTACFLLPLLVIVFCYGAVLRTLLAGGQRYAHAVRVTVLVLLIFLVCFLPSNILLLLHYTNSELITDEQDLYVPYMVSLAVSTFNSCIDPFIFYYVSDDFRARVRKALCCQLIADRDSSSGNRVSYSSSGKSGKSKTTLLSKSDTTLEQSAAL